MQPVQRVGRYVLGRRLGEGGEGAVYDAVLEGPGGLRKPVALKLLRATRAPPDRAAPTPVSTGPVLVHLDRPTVDAVSIGDPAHRGRGLRREGRIGGLLRHRNLVDVYEVGEADGQWFCAMERCDRSLADCGPLPPRAVVEVGLQVCAALTYAHEALGLVHRDLKPQNLLLSGAVVKVADLGLAIARGFESRTGVAGTPGYLAPEARVGAVDARADVFALGVTLAQLASGYGPGSGSTFTLANCDAPGVDGRASVPAWLADVVERCTDPEPDRRFPSPAALADALRRLEVTGPSLVELFAPRAEGRQDGRLAPADRPLIGREGDLVGVDALLGAPGLFTLKGPAGVGKTALALEGARRWQARTGRRAWWCELSGARTQGDLVATVARSLGIPLGGAPVGEQATSVGRALAGRDRCLLLLDDAGHLVEHAAVFDGWRRAAPDAVLVVTSRRALGLGGEKVVEVGPLDEAAAIELLRTRARDRGLELSGSDDVDLASLAARLDGLPLALELAAGRLGVLSPADLLGAFDLSVLRSAGEGRNATLSDALDWSWELLAPAARTALGRLAAFEGSFTAEAAEAVIEDDGWAALDTLLDHSLVRVRPPRVGFVGEAQRLALLAPVRAYTEERSTPGERDEAEIRHARWFALVASPENPDGPAAVDAVLRTDAAEVVVACDRALRRGDAELAAPLTVAAVSALAQVGPVDRGPALVDAALALATDPIGRGRLLTARWWAAHHAGERRDEAWLTAAIATADAHGDATLATDARKAHVNHLLHAGRLAEAETVCAELGPDAWNTRYIVAYSKGRPEEARQAAAAGVDDARRSGQRSKEGVALANLANVLFDLGAHDEALRYAEESIAIAEEGLELHYLGQRHGNLGAFYTDLGRLALARPQYERALAVQRSVGNLRSVGHVSLNLGNLCLEERDVAAAEAHFDRAVEASTAVGDARIAGLALAVRGVIRAELGALAVALEDVRRAATVAERSGDRRVLAHVRCQVADVAGLAGDLDLADAALDAIGADLDPWPAERASADCAVAMVRYARGDLAGGDAILARVRAMAEGPDGSYLLRRKVEALERRAAAARQSANA